MGLGMETEAVEHKRSTGEMREGMESIATILNKHGHGTLYFGMHNDGEVIGQEVSEKTLLFSLASAGERYILNNTRRALVIDGSSFHRTEVTEIPMEAVREALLNALCRRVYETNAAVQVDIFWDRVDIYSPGPFQAGVSPEADMQAARERGRAYEGRPRPARGAQGAPHGADGGCRRAEGAGAAVDGGGSAGSNRDEKAPAGGPAGARGLGPPRQEAALP